jgi:hypothetical protein
MNVDGHRLRGESTCRHLETVAPIGQAGECMDSLSIGVKASDISGREVLQFTVGGNGSSGRIFHFDPDLTGRTLGTHGGRDRETREERAHKYGVCPGSAATESEHIP